jgi:hypothetical protein
MLQLVVEVVVLHSITMVPMADQVVAPVNHHANLSLLILAQVLQVKEMLVLMVAMKVITHTEVDLEEATQQQLCAADQVEKGTHWTASPEW